MRYKNITDEDLAIPGVGIVKAGEVAELPESFHNANFQLVEQKETKPKGKKAEPDEEDNKNKE